MNLFLLILRDSVSLFVAMAPYLLLGFALAGVLSVVVPRAWVARHLGGRGWRAVLKGALAGIPLPLCSCGVIPFASSLQKQGAGRGATTAFLIATPQTGADSVLVTYSFLGLPFALFRVVAALLTGVCGGFVAAGLDRTRPREAPAVLPAESSRERIPVVDRLKAAARFGLEETVSDVAGWLLLGVVVAGIIQTVLPADALSPERFGGTFPAMLGVLVVAVPMYVCATSSVPIAAALVAKGMPLGAALVFLIAGPATNAATLSVFTRTLGKRTVGAYLGSIVVLSVLLGWAFEALWGGASLGLSPSHLHPETDAWWMRAAAFVLAGLLVRALFANVQARLASRRSQEAPDSAPRLQLTVVGMNCDNCRRHVEAALQAAAPETVIRVDLDAGRVSVFGPPVNPDSLIRAVEKAGYGASVAVRDAGTISQGPPHA